MNPNNTNIELPNPEELRRLAEEEPEKLEELQSLLNKQIIESAPEHIQPRLQGILWQVEGERRRHSNPLGKAVALYKLMMGSLVELNDVLHGRVAEDSPEDAVILDFPKKSS